METHKQTDGILSKGDEEPTAEVFRSNDTNKSLFE